MWGIICQQPVPLSDTKDAWSWSPTGSGNFTFSSACEIIRPPSAIFQFAEIIWFPCNSPKMSCCLLRAIHSRLLTRNFLKSIGVCDTDTCVLCQTHSESVQHLSLNVPTLNICGLSLLKLGLSAASVGTLQEKAILIKNKFKNKTKSTILARLSLSATVWHTWKERNSRVFQLQESHKIVVFRRLHEDISVLLRTCN